MGHGFLSFNARIPSNGETLRHPWLLFLAWKTIIFCYCCKLFSFRYTLSHSTQHFSLLVLHSYLPSDQGGSLSAQRGRINEGCNSLIYWI